MSQQAFFNFEFYLSAGIDRGRVDEGVGLDSQISHFVQGRQRLLPLLPPPTPDAVEAVEESESESRLRLLIGESSLFIASTMLTAEAGTPAPRES